MHKKIMWSCLAVLLLAATYSNKATAQTTPAQPQQQQMGGQKQPPLSPPATADATIGGKKISIKYSAPSVRNRKIMGDLVPYGTVWRTGANAATTLVTDADLMIGDLRVPKGTYTLYSLPGETEWKLIVNKQTGQWGTEYKEDQDLGRVNLNVSKTSAPVEKFIISIEPGGNNGATLKMMWENTQLSAPITLAQ